MVSIILLCIVLIVIPILNTVNYHIEASPLFIEMVGAEPRRCVFAILVLGYAFDVVTVSLVIASVFCRALEFRVTFVVGWGDLAVGFGAIVSTCIFLGFVNPKVCSEYEHKLGYALYANQTSEAFRRWLREERCFELAECIVSAHKFVTDTCLVRFDQNLTLVTSGIALLIVGIICVGFTQSSGGDGEEEEEDLAGDGG
jgi:hypothetical protein